MSSDLEIDMLRVNPPIGQEHEDITVMLLYFKL